MCWTNRRGTSTFDGISIAWAVAEYLHNQESVFKAKTLFATHYHELTEPGPDHARYKKLQHPGQRKERPDRFFAADRARRADKSYGIQVARLAGMPIEVIDRAKEILGNLEEGNSAKAVQPKIARERTRRVAATPIRCRSSTHRNRRAEWTKAVFQVSYGPVEKTDNDDQPGTQSIDRETRRPGGNGRYCARRRSARQFVWLRLRAAISFSSRLASMGLMVGTQ